MNGFVGKASGTLLAVVVGLLLLAANAWAPPPPPPPQIYTVCPTGPPMCDFATVQGAVDGSSANDGIVIEPGTYNEQVTVGKKLHISGNANGPRPIITDDHSGLGVTTFKVTSGGAGTIVNHLDLRATGGPNSAVLYSSGSGTLTASDLGIEASFACGLVVGSTLTNVTVTQTGTGAACLSLGGGSTMTDSTVDASGEALVLEGSTARRVTVNGGPVGVDSSIGTTANVLTDSLVTARDQNSVAVRAGGTSNGTTTMGQVLTLRNVTAIAGGAGSVGIEARIMFNTGGTSGPAQIDAKDVIARGATHDVIADACPPMVPCEDGKATIDYSNFTNSSGATAGAHNRTADPQFVDSALGPCQDFHIASASSPAVGAGIADGSTDATDLDGVAWANPRTIGAYEFAGARADPCPPTPSGTPGGGATGLSGGTSPGAVFAAIASLRASPSAFPAAGSGGSLTAARKRKTGTTISYVDSQAATTTFTVLQPQRGIKAKGGRCVKPRKGKRGKRCTRYVRKGSFKHLDTAGADRLHFTGRVNSRKLSPGPYRLQAVPALNGHAGPAVTTSFRIIR